MQVFGGRFWRTICELRTCDFSILIFLETFSELAWDTAGQLNRRCSPSDGVRRCFLRRASELEPKEPKKKVYGVSSSFQRMVSKCEVRECGAMCQCCGFYPHVFLCSRDLMTGPNARARSSGIALASPETRVATIRRHPSP